MKIITFDSAIPAFEGLEKGMVDSRNADSTERSSKAGGVGFSRKPGDQTTNSFGNRQ